MWPDVSMSVLFSHNCGHFNHAAGSIASFHIVWGVKRWDCSAVSIQPLRIGAGLASAELPLCRVSHQIYWSLSCRCWLHYSSIQQIIHSLQKGLRRDKYLFSCGIVSSVEHIWAGGQWQQKPQQGSAAISSGPTELLRRKKNPINLWLGTQGKVNKLLKDPLDIRL